MQVVYSAGFLKSLSQFPDKIQTKTASLLGILENNPFHPLLHTKKLTGPLAGFFSFRITRDYRIIFEFAGPDTIRLIQAADRKEIYR